jgi:tRNA-splicing ligase RtcB
MHPNVTAVFGTHDQNTLVQLDDVASRAVRAALMGDGHYGYVMPVGGVAAYDNAVSVIGVGFDIACGNAAIRTDLTLERLTGLAPEEARANPYAVSQNRRLNDLADALFDTLSFGIGRRNAADDAPTDHRLFNHPAWAHVPNSETEGWHRDELREKARRQLGTIGGGNHYVDLFYDEAGRIWTGVHFGSRGFGHTVAKSVLALHQGGKWGGQGKEVECILPLDTPLGQMYWDLMNLAGEYAYAGREWVARKAVRLLGATELELVHNHHNFAWPETHWVEPEPGAAPEPRGLVVVRKGATPAWPGQKGFVGGSMGDDSVILRGTDNDFDATWGLQRSALFSTVHGAGRVMSRTEAAGKRDRKTGQLKRDRQTGEIVKPGKVTPEMMKAWLAEKGVVLRGGDLDESPHCYRRLPDVLRAQGGTIEVLHRLSPLVVCMASADSHDPYRD